MCTLSATTRDGARDNVASRCFASRVREVEPARVPAKLERHGAHEKTQRTVELRVSILVESVYNPARR
jgi:hypothetical protein